MLIHHLDIMDKIMEEVERRHPKLVIKKYYNELTYEEERDPIRDDFKADKVDVLFATPNMYVR